jgi:outer membrane protein assembly factor BamE (lipoprotein component of BamABCDE complex)
MNRTRVTWRRGIGTLGAACACALLTGCLVAGSSSTKQSGTFVGPSTLAQIEEGATQASWVRAVLGEPDETTALEDGSEVWRWQWTRNSKRSGGVFLIVAGSSRSEASGFAWVQVRDGIVIKKGRDATSTE